jgi:DNA modification methylase
MTPYAEGRGWTLYAGDCLDVLRQLPRGSVDAVVTDPPYGISYQSGWCADGPRFGVLAGDDAPCVEWCAEGARVLTSPGAVVCFHEWRHAEAFRVALVDAGLDLRSQVVWDRVGHGMGDLRAAWAPRHDLAWWATSGQWAFHGRRPASVMRFDRVPAHEMVHPTQKPLDLMRYVVGIACRPTGVLLDPFAGSGTTGVAALAEGRRCILIEREPAYLEIAARRMREASTDGVQVGMFGGTP